MNSQQQRKDKIDCPSKTENCTSKVDGAYRCSETGLIVEFRPKQDYGGEFGFDWLRIHDKDVDPQKNRGGFTEEPYKQAIITGYESDTSRLDKDTAYENLKAEYNPLSEADSKLLVKRDGYEDSAYYVPFLNIFSKESSEALKTQIPSLVIDPPYKAELRLIFYASGIKADQVIFEFPDAFKVNEQTSPYYWPHTMDFCALNVNKDGSEAFKIECLEDISEEQYIEVYGIYNEGTAEEEKLLAGKLCLLPNDEDHRQILEIVQIKVELDLSVRGVGDILVGEFQEEEINKVYMGLYQSLIIPSFIESNLDLKKDPLWKREDKDLELMAKKGMLESPEGRKRQLRNDPEWYMWAAEVYMNPPRKDSRYLELAHNIFNHEGVLIYENSEPTELVTFKDNQDVRTLPYLKNKYIFQKKLSDSKINQKMLVFSFPIPMRISPFEPKGLGGRVLDIGEKLILLSSNRNFDGYDYCHELLHSLGLEHTFLNANPKDPSTQSPPEKQARFIFKEAFTNNIIDTPSRMTTWKWQWDILHRNVGNQ